MQRTWTGELERLDLYEVVIQEQDVEVKVEIPVNVDDRYVILPGREGPRLYCTTCRLFLGQNDLDIKLSELVKESLRHEDLNHYNIRRGN